MPHARIALVRDTRDIRDEPVSGIRSLRPDDGVALGPLMYEAYKGTEDYEGESLEDAVEEMSRTLSGKYGPVLWDLSFVLERKGIPVGAVIVTKYGDEGIPLIAFTFTHPDFKRTGIAARMMRVTLSEAGRKGFPKLRLYVNPQNIPAVTLYKKLGFVDEP